MKTARQTKPLPRRTAVSCQCSGSSHCSVRMQKCRMQMSRHCVISRMRAARDVPSDGRDSKTRRESTLLIVIPHQRQPSSMRCNIWLHCPLYCLHPTYAQGIGHALLNATSLPMAATTKLGVLPAQVDSRFAKTQISGTTRFRTSKHREDPIGYVTSLVVACQIPCALDQHLSRHRHIALAFQAHLGRFSDFV